MRGRRLTKVCSKATVSLNIEDVLPDGGHRGGETNGGAGVEEERQRSGLVHMGLVGCCQAEWKWNCESINGWEPFLWCDVAFVL